jgi:serine/threonine protein kinase
MRRPPIIAGKYVLIRLLGRGAMGAVYESVQMETGLRAALKVLRVLDRHDAAVLAARFEREAQAIRTIASRHVPRILEAGRDPQTGIQFIAMDFLRGEGLDKLTRRMDGLSTDLALRIGAQTCEGLAAAHGSGVIHRDVKPQNIFLSSEGGEVVVKILDFGVAKLKMDHLREGSEELTDTGSMLGSPRYMSPEQARGAKHIDARADIWSLGVVMYEMLAGVVPHAEAKTIGNLMVEICRTPPKPIRERIRWVSPEYERIVMRALRMDPAERYQTAAEMLQDITRLLPRGSASINTKMMVPPDAMPTHVLRREPAPQPHATPFDSAIDDADLMSDAGGEDDLATQVVVWARKHPPRPTVPEEEEDNDDFPTEVMNYDDFPTEVLKNSPAPLTAMGEESSDEYPTNRKLEVPPELEQALPRIVDTSRAVPQIAPAPAPRSAPRLALVMDSDSSIHLQKPGDTSQDIQREAAAWKSSGFGAYKSWLAMIVVVAVAAALAIWFVWQVLGSPQ